MIAYILLGVALAVGFVLILKWFVATEPKSLIRVFKWVGLVLLAVVTLLLAATGRLAWALGTALALFPYAMRLYRAHRTAKNYARAAGFGGRQASTIETRHLRMRLDHETGGLDGEVLEGPFAGRRLGDLDLQQVWELLRACRAEDAQSAQVLEAYLDRAHAGWRERCESETAGGETAQGGADDGPMTREQAYAILGLAPSASDDEIRSAHHRLISMCHPDRGGSNYLAAKVNEARRVLLGR